VALVDNNLDHQSPELKQLWRWSAKGTRSLDHQAGPGNYGTSSACRVTDAAANSLDQGTSK